MQEEEEEAHAARPDQEPPQAGVVALQQPHEEELIASTATGPSWRHYCHWHPNSQILKQAFVLSRPQIHHQYRTKLHDTAPQTQWQPNRHPAAARQSGPGNSRLRLSQQGRSMEQPPGRAALCQWPLAHCCLHSDAWAPCQTGSSPEVHAEGYSFPQLLQLEGHV